MRQLILQKKTGCKLEVVVYSNGKVAACWVPPAPVPEVAVYDNIEEFFKVRSPERGYTVIYDSAVPDPMKIVRTDF